MERVLTLDNINVEITRYESSIESIGDSLLGFQGVPLLQHLKRDKVNSGPYPHVTLFEAANRIMTDLVILKGVKWILDNNVFPFTSYLVEYGNEDSNEHDISSEENGIRLNGEAFNVAPSFFQGKKNSMIKKLRNNPVVADYSLILANSDSVSKSYRPKLRENEYFIFIDVQSGEGVIFQ